MAADEKSTKGVERRTVLRGLATGIAGAVAAPSASSLAETAPPSAPVQTGPEATAGSPRLLNAHDHETLVSLSEQLVPGSASAGAPDLLDRVAAVDTHEAQRALLAALRAFEGEARASHGARWIELAPDVQRSILDQAASGSRPELGGALVYLRDAIAHTYFGTEPGMRQLGWTPRSAWRELPSCDHPGDDHR